MNKLYKLSNCLTEKYFLSEADAEEFVSTLFSVIRERLETDHQVKVKGLGTFKIAEMNARDSVDINTGERIRIEGRYKVSFTPENAVRDRINSPFASFESVDLEDDNIDFTDIDDRYRPFDAVIPAVSEGHSTEMTEDIQPDVVETPKDTENQDVPLVETTAVPEQDKTVEATVEEPVVETPVEESVTVETTPEVEQPVISETQEVPVAEPLHAPIPEPAVESVTVPRNPHCESLIKNDIDYSKKILTLLRWLLGLVVVALICAGGYFIYDVGRDNGAMEYYLRSNAIENQEEDFRRRNTVSTEETEAAVSTAASVVPPAEPVAKVEPKPTPQPVVKPVENSTSADEPSNIYNKDARVRTGAYNIVGLDKEVTVRAGQTLQSISRLYLGEGMECYVEAYNGVKSVKAGDKLRIPKLQLKKRNRKKK